MRKRIFLGIIFGIALLAVLGWAAENANDSTQVVSPAPDGKETSTTNKTQTLRAGDRLNVKIYPEDTYIKGGEMVVSNEGDITLPLLGKMKVEGLKPLEAEQKLVRLLAQDYLVNPVVVIEVTRDIPEEAKASVSILGQVQKPGTYQLPEEEEIKKLTLLQLISMAGGFTDVANVKKIKVIRKSGGKAEVIRANAEAIMSGGQPDIELKEQDVVHVGESLF